MGKKNYLVTVIDHGENTDMHARKLGLVKTLAEGQQLINEDKQLYRSNVLANIIDAKPDEFFEKLNEIWWLDDFANGRVYDIFEIV